MGHVLPFSRFSFVVWHNPLTVNGGRSSRCLGQNARERETPKYLRDGASLIRFRFFFVWSALFATQWMFMFVLAFFFLVWILIRTFLEFLLPKRFRAQMLKLCQFFCMWCKVWKCFFLEFNDLQIEIYIFCIMMKITLRIRL